MRMKKGPRYRNREVREYFLPNDAEILSGGIDQM